MRILGSLVLAAALANALVGCAPVEKLRKRAAFDLECPAEQLEVVDLDGVTKGVRGCGNRATYIWMCGEAQTCAWVMNTDTRKESSAP